jgi:hypothetical protein
MLDDAEKRKKGLRRGGSKPGRKKSKPWQRLKGLTMLLAKVGGTYHALR